MLWPRKCRQKRIYSIFACLGVACTIFIFFQLFSIQLLDLYAERSSRENFEERIKSKHANLPAMNNFSKIESINQCVVFNNCSNGHIALDGVGLEWLKGKEVEQELRLPKLIFSSSEKRVTKKLQDKKWQENKVEMLVDDEAALKEKLGMRVETDIWKLLEKRWLVGAGLTIVDVDSSLVNTTRGVSSSWRHLYVPDTEGFFSCIQTKVGFIVVSTFIWHHKNIYTIPTA